MKPVFQVQYTCLIEIEHVFTLQYSDATRYLLFNFGLLFWQKLSYSGLALGFVSGVHSQCILSWEVSNP